MGEKWHIFTLYSFYTVRTLSSFVKVPNKATAARHLLLILVTSLVTANWDDIPSLLNVNQRACVGH